MFQEIENDDNFVVKKVPKYEDLMLEVEAEILNGFNTSWFYANSHWKVFRIASVF